MDYRNIFIRFTFEYTTHANIHTCIKYIKEEKKSLKGNKFSHIFKTGIYCFYLTHRFHVERLFNPGV